MSEAATAAAPEAGPGPGADATATVGLGPRTVAALIDNLFWIFGFFFVAAFIPQSATDDETAMGILALVWLSAWFNYFAVCEWRWGQTIGKSAMRIRVVRSDGGDLPFGPASVRNVLRLVDFFVIGWVMVATGARHQRLGDLAAGTVVLAGPRHRTRTAAAAGGSGADVRAAAPASAAGAGEAASTGPSAAGAAGGGQVPQGPGGERRLPVTPWGIRDTVWGLVGGLILAIIVAPALVLPFDPDLESLGAVLAAQALLAASLLMVALGQASGWRFRPLRATFERLGLRRFRPSALGLSLLTLIGYYIAVAIFAALVLEPNQEDIGGELGLDDGSLAAAIAAVVLIVVVAPFVEELFFRGFVFGGLRSRLSLWPAVIISGLVFGSIHAPTGITAVIPLAALGMALAWLYDRTGSLWPPIFVHTVNNALALAVTAALAS